MELITQKLFQAQVYSDINLQCMILTLTVLRVEIISPLAFAVVPPLPVGDKNSSSDGVFCRNIIGTFLVSHNLMKCVPFIAAVVSSGPLLASTPTKYLLKIKKIRHTILCTHKHLVFKQNQHNVCLKHSKLF